MEIQKFYWCLLIALFLSAQRLKGADIMGCDRNRTIEATEDKPLRMQCRLNTHLWFGYYKNDYEVEWKISRGATNITDAGTCVFSDGRINRDLSGINCTSQLSPDITVAVDNYSSSSLTIGKVSRQAMEGTTISCAETGTPRRYGNEYSSCRLKIVYDAEVASCSLDVDRLSWKFWGSCDITKIYSSDGHYSCNPETQLNNTSRWTAASSALVSFQPAPFHDADSDQLYYRGRCNFSYPLPGLHGTLAFSILVSPGNKRAQAGEVTLAAPSDDLRLVNCGQFYLPESGGSPKTPCVCSVSSLGSPEGRLIWYSKDTMLAAGDYGVTSLQFPYDTVDRRLDGTNLTCGVDWVVSTRSSPFTAKVAYGPDTVTIQYPRSFEANGNNTMFLTCIASEVHPQQAYLQLWGGLCEDQRGRTCKLTPHGPRDDEEEVTCKAINQVNNGHSASVRVLLNLRYPPSEPPVITGYAQQPLFGGDELSLVCTAKGGKPPVRSVTLSCPTVLSPDNKVTQPGEQTKITIGVTAGDHGKECVCTALWQEEDLYTLAGKITLFVLNGTRPQQQPQDAYGKGRSEGIGTGVGIMLILLLVVLAVVLFVQWRRGRLPHWLVCDPVYDLPRTGQVQGDEHHYSDLTTYEAVGGPSCKSACEASTSTVKKPNENIYVNNAVATV